MIYSARQISEMWSRGNVGLWEAFWGQPVLPFSLHASEVVQLVKVEDALVLFRDSGIPGAVEWDVRISPGRVDSLGMSLEPNGSVDSLLSPLQEVSVQDTRRNLWWGPGRSLFSTSYLGGTPDTWPQQSGAWSLWVAPSSAHPKVPVPSWTVLETAAVCGWDFSSPAASLRCS